MAHTLRFHRRHLPHWEVPDGRYFVTVRCADSLPHDVVLQLQEISINLSRFDPQSAQFAELQRRSFHTLDKYLDAGTGSCPLRRPAVANIVVEELAAMADWQVDIPHFTIMPNHWHVMLMPETDCRHTLSDMMKRLKGRTAKKLRALIGGSGPVWQREWFDRWMRNDGEWEKCVAYIRNNPVKARLVSSWPEHPWTK
jgi:type I restriction enzyme R subunit